MSRLVPQAFDLSPNPVQKVEGDLVAQCEGAAGVGVVFACGKVAFGMGLDLALFLDVVVCAFHANAQHARRVEGLRVGDPRLSFDEVRQFVCRFQYLVEVIHVSPLHS